MSEFLRFSPMIGCVWVSAPVTADAYRKSHPENIWYYNPWTGQPRDPRDVETDPQGLMIVAPGAPLVEAKKGTITDTIADTLTERGKRYGKFTGHAKITQDLKAVMRSCPKWEALAPDQKESLEMVVHKIGRILNGDPDYDDSWVDIAGYTKLVADRLQGVER